MLGILQAMKPTNLIGSTSSSNKSLKALGQKTTKHPRLFGIVYDLFIWIQFGSERKKDEENVARKTAFVAILFYLS